MSITKKKTNSKARSVPPLVAAVVKPVAQRLSRIETLLMELRFDQSTQLKRVTDLQVEMDVIAAEVRADRGDIRRLAHVGHRPGTGRAR
jgi:hypothetical protein